MATVEMSSATEQIGITAGVVWHTLSVNGPMTFTKLAKAVDAPRDLVSQAIGWLAREDKITIDERNRSRVISLVDQD